MKSIHFISFFALFACSEVEKNTSPDDTPPQDSVDVSEDTPSSGVAEGSEGSVGGSDGSTTVWPDEETQVKEEECWRLFDECLAAGGSDEECWAQWEECFPQDANSGSGSSYPPEPYPGDDWFLICDQIFQECLMEGGSEDECWRLFDECLMYGEYPIWEEELSCWDEFEICTEETGDAELCWPDYLECHDIELAEAHEESCWNELEICLDEGGDPDSCWNTYQECLVTDVVVEEPEPEEPTNDVDCQGLYLECINIGFDPLECLAMYEDCTTN